MHVVNFNYTENEDFILISTWQDWAPGVWETAARGRVASLVWGPRRTPDPDRGEAWGAEGFPQAYELRGQHSTLAEGGQREEPGRTLPTPAACSPHNMGA